MQNWMDLDPRQESIELNNLIQQKRDARLYAGHLFSIIKL